MSRLLIQQMMVAMLFASLAACSKPADDPGLIAVKESLPATPAAESISGADLFVLACQGCHNIEAGAPHRAGPNLFGILDQPAASQAGFAYSPALQSSGLSWSRASLAAWVVAAETLVPGTWMLYHNELLPHEVLLLISYIEQAGPLTQP